MWWLAPTLEQYSTCKVIITAVSSTSSIIVVNQNAKLSRWFLESWHCIPYNINPTNCRGVKTFHGWSWGVFKNFPIKIACSRSNLKPSWPGRLGKKCTLSLMWYVTKTGAPEAGPSWNINGLGDRFGFLSRVGHDIHVIVSISIQWHYLCHDIVRVIMIMMTSTLYRYMSQWN